MKPKSKADATLAAIESLTATLGYAPTVRELGDHFGISKTAAWLRIKSLRDAGRVTWVKNKNRTLTVVRT